MLPAYIEPNDASTIEHDATTDTRYAYDALAYGNDYSLGIGDTDNGDDVAHAYHALGIPDDNDRLAIGGVLLA